MPCATATVLSRCRRIARPFFEQIYPYWKGRTLQDHLLPLLPEQTACSRFDAMIYAVGHHETGGFFNLAKALELALSDGVRQITGKP